jgi:hypothetical protein
VSRPRRDRSTAWALVCIVMCLAVLAYLLWAAIALSGAALDGAG